MRIFLSTLPARGATCFFDHDLATCRFLSTLPARGATCQRVTQSCGVLISIHAPREGSDTPNMGLVFDGGISIHAPREGSDCCNTRRRRKGGDFYPRSPRGERQEVVATREGTEKFLSTLPARGATE